MSTEPTKLNDPSDASAPQSPSEGSSVEASPGTSRSPVRRPTRAPSADVRADAIADIRRGTGDFEFGALLKGVGTGSGIDENRGEIASREPVPSVLPERVPVDGENAGPETLPGESSKRETSAFRPVVPGPMPGVQPTAPSGTPAPAPRSRRGLPVAVWVGLALALVIPVGFFVGNSMNGQRAVATTAPPASPATGTAEMGKTGGGRKPGRPDPRLTPGHRLSHARAEVKVSEDTRLQVLQAYGIDPAGEGQKMVMVRLIPATMGGTEEPANLFPTTPWFVDLKIRLDRYLANEVRQGRMTVTEAEKVLTTDWVAALHRYNIRNYGHTDPNAVRETEKKLAW